MIAEEDFDEDDEEMDDDMAAQWAAMLDDEDEEEADPQQKGADRILNQDEIDNLLGFNAELGHDGESSGVRAIINSALVSYERLPMLEIIFDRLVRLTTTSLRNFTSDNVEVSLDGITSVRFGDYLNSIPLPAILSVFKAEEWDNFGLITVDSSLIYSVIDVLLGGRRSSSSMRVEGRPYTTIEMNLVRRMVEVLISDAEAAFAPLSKVTFNVDRLETNPRFATICRPANAAILVEMRVDMEDRGGKVELLIPYATIEPIRELLLQMFMGEKFGRDSIWEGHLATEIYSANVDVDAVLYEEMMPLSKVMSFKKGQTLMFETAPTDSIMLKCGGTVLTEGQLGQRDRGVAVRVMKDLRRPKTTLASFEHADKPPQETT
ncbi:MAG: flagellar motor switch protein FliM [Hyphomicrobiales bacterium]